MNKKTAELIDILFGFRKFILMLVVLLIAIIFRVQSYLDGQQFTDLMKAVVLGFFTANGFEHASLACKDYLKASRPQPTEPKPECEGEKP